MSIIINIITKCGQVPWVLDGASVVGQDVGAGGCGGVVGVGVVDLDVVDGGGLAGGGNGTDGDRVPVVITPGVGMKFVRAALSCLWPGLGAVLPVGAKLIVCAALFRIFQHFVGFVDILEAGFCVLFPDRRAHV